MRPDKARLTAIILNAFLAVTALWGALFVVPQLPMSLLRWGPFSDFVVPAVGLCSVGVVALVGATAAIWRPTVAAVASVLAGSAIVAFEIVEAAVVGSVLNVPPGMNEQGFVALWLQPFYAIVGVALVILGISLARRYRVIEDFMRWVSHRGWTPG